MFNNSSLNVFIYAAILMIIMILIKVFQKPLKFLSKLILNCFAGSSLILVINTLCAQFGFQIAVNAVTLTLCALLGIASPVFLTFFNILF